MPGECRLCGILIVFLVSCQAAQARLVPRRDARDGVLDAQLVVIVRQNSADVYEIDEVFLGKAAPGDSISLPGFQLATRQSIGPDKLERISNATRILLFLQHKKNDPNAWEPTDYGYCFFWVQEPDRVFELRNIARSAVALRHRWEDAARLTDLQERVEALWPYIYLRDYGVSFLEHTKVELRKAGVIAGDYFAGQFDNMSPDERSPLYYEAGSYGSEKLHQTMIRHLEIEQLTIESFEVAHSFDAKALRENWNSMPKDVRSLYGDIPGLLYGLRSIGDRADLPLFRGAAAHALKFGPEQALIQALGAFREMPDKENLATIAVIWKSSESGGSEDREMVQHDVIGALCTHNYPETVPLLAPFITHPYAAPEVEDALSRIVGTDLGRTLQPWLEWYQAYQITQH
jgi:hypothetical protein